MKRHLFNLLLLTALVVSLSACRTSVPKLDYKALARASVRLGVDIGMEDNHKLYLEAAQWIGTPYRGGGETKRGTDCSGMTCQIYKKVYHIKLQRSTDGQKKESSKDAQEVIATRYHTHRGYRLTWQTGGLQLLRVIENGFADSS